MVGIDTVKILVVEDDDIDRLAFKRASKLYHIKLEADLVTSLEETRHALANKSYDVIFTDYYLDDGTAKDVIQLSGTTPVLVATGTNDIQIAVDILKDGAYDFLVKDIDRSYLRVLPYTIEKVLEKRKAIESQQILSTVVTNIRENVIIINENDEIVFVNPSFCETYGYSESEIAGIPASILLPVHERVNSTSFSENRIPVDQIHLKKDGTEFYVSVTISPMEMENNSSNRSRIMVTRDVSERVRMVEQIKTSQQQLFTIFDNSAVGIALFEISGRLLQFNSMFSDLLGYNDDFLLGKNLADLSHPADRTIDRANYISLLKGRTPSYTAERRLIRVDGSIVWTRLTVSLVRDDETDRALYTIVIFEDMTEKKQIEKALKESEVRVEGIVTSLKDVVYSIEPKTLHINYVNKAVEEVFGISQEEFQKDTTHWKKMIHGGDLAKLLESQETIVKEGRVEVEYRIISPSGGIRWVRDRSWIVKNEDGEVVRLDGIITDISKRKIAEQAFRDSEERYRTAVESSIEAIYMMNPISLQVIEANDAFCKLLGYNHEEALALTIDQFVKGSRENLNLLINNIIDTGGGQLGERTWVTKQGSEIIVQVNASRIRQRDQETLFVVARDITEEKKIHDALDLERKLLKEVVTNAPIPMALLDHELKFMIHSKKWLQTYGPVRQTIEGKQLFEVYDDLPIEWKSLCERGVNGEVLNIPEQEVKTHDGRLMYLRLAIHPWGNPAIQHGIVLVAERIDELVNARKLAEEANHAKSAFLARITHELRTPLNAILGYSQILTKDSTLSSTHHGYVDSMYRSGMHLLNMINDILDLSKIEASRMDLQESVMNLSELFTDLYEMFRMKCENSGITLKFDIDPRVHPYVVTDRNKFNQILINLIGNAVKFTEKGSVSVVVSLIEYNDDIQKISISVKDTGIGIPEDDIEKIFEPFHQSRNTGIQGTGLGLSITQKLVSLLGGKIGVESQLGVGTKFTVELSFVISASQITDKTDQFNRVIGVKSPKIFTVLVADDVDHNRHVVRLLLERIGIKVLEAENGEEAVHLYKKSIPDLIIMDIIMPVMDGVKAMSIIRANENGTQVPIIALTASGFDDKKDKLLEAGFSDYILKPFTESVLLRSIADHGNVEFNFEDIEAVVEATEETISVRSAMKSWIEIDAEIRDKIFNYIEVQDFEPLREIVNTPAVKESNPILCQLITNAVDSFDFFVLNQILKAIRDQAEN